MNTCSCSSTDILEAAETRVRDFNLTRHLSKYRVAMRTYNGSDVILITSPERELQVRITLTDKGPVLSLAGARLELESLDTVAVRCRKFEVNATESACIAGEASVRILGQDLSFRAKADARMEGERVLFNCPEDF